MTGTNIISCWVYLSSHLLHHPLVAITGSIEGQEYSKGAPFGASHMAGALQQSFMSDRNPPLIANVLLKDAGFFNKQRK